jgi:hypothetical protein
MKRKLVIEVETTEMNQDPEDALADLGTFADALADGSILKCASRTDADGNGYPELGHLRVKIIHSLDPQESAVEVKEEGESEE